MTNTWTLRSARSACRIPAERRALGLTDDDTGMLVGSIVPEREPVTVC